MSSRRDLKTTSSANPNSMGLYQKQLSHIMLHIVMSEQITLQPLHKLWDNFKVVLSSQLTGEIQTGGDMFPREIGELPHNLLRAAAGGEVAEDETYGDPRPFDTGLPSQNIRGANYVIPPVHAYPLLILTQLV